MTQPKSSLPVISLSTLLGDSGAASRDREIARLREVTHEIGFFYLADHGVPPELQDELFQVAKEFFALPLAAKEGDRLHGQSPLPRIFPARGGTHTG